MKIDMFGRQDNKCPLAFAEGLFVRIEGKYLVML